LTDNGFEWYPFIWDLHDCITVEVREEDAAAAKRILEQVAYEELNRWMGSAIGLKGEAVVGKTWGDLKESPA
jgi:hypothetical protein